MPPKEPHMRFVAPSVVATHFHLREGDHVADFGAGAGHFVAALSRAVGGQGRVYACDIQKQHIEKLEIRKRDERLTNLEPLWCDIEAAQGIALPDRALDGGILVNTLFQFEKKEAALLEIARVLRAGAKLFVIDWSESFGSMGPAPQAVVSEDAARSLLEHAGFSFQRSFDAGRHHYGLAFQKV